MHTPDPSLRGWKVQMPKYGLLLRSHLLAEFPDIVVSVERTQDGEGVEQAPILVRKMLGKDVMYCFFDCVPPDIRSITLKLIPANQQRYTIGDTITEKRLTLSFKKIYTQSDPSRWHARDDNTPVETMAFSMERGEIFDTQSRTYIHLCHKLNRQHISP
ncbi:hypothetical protein QBC46DRAFT_384260, partial [Diplogelasinospora grovesii]